MLVEFCSRRPGDRLAFTVNHRYIDYRGLVSSARDIGCNLVHLTVLELQGSELLSSLSCDG
jgi:hypothetical protein